MKQTTYVGKRTGRLDRRDEQAVGEDLRNLGPRRGLALECLLEGANEIMAERGGDEESVERELDGFAVDVVLCEQLGERGSIFRDLLRGCARQVVSQQFLEEAERRCWTR